MPFTPIASVWVRPIRIDELLAAKALPLDSLHPSMSRWFVLHGDHQRSGTPAEGPSKRSRLALHPGAASCPTDLLPILPKPLLRLEEGIRGQILDPKGEGKTDFEGEISSSPFLFSVGSSPMHGTPKSNLTPATTRAAPSSKGETAPSTGFPGSKERPVERRALQSAVRSRPHDGSSAEFLRVR